MGERDVVFDATCTLDLTLNISTCLKNKYTIGIFKKNLLCLYECGNKALCFF